MIVPTPVTDVGTFLKRAECRMENCYSGCKDGFWGGNCDKHCDCADDVPCRMLDVLPNVRTGSREKGVINNVTVRMKDHVIRLTVYVQAVTASLDVLLLVSLNEKVKCFTFKYFFLGKMAKYLC